MTEKTELLDLALKAAIKAGKKTREYYDTEMTVVVKDDHSPLTRADLESNQIINDYLVRTEIPILSEENRNDPYEVRKQWTTFWLIDPLDGTKEFINKRAEYTINIALVEKGVPVLGVVYAPVLDILYFGLKGSGSYKLKGAEALSKSKIRKHAHEISVGKLSRKLRIVASRSHLSDETSKFIEVLKKSKPVSEIKSIGSSLKLCIVAEGAADIYPRLGPTMEWDTAASHAVVLNAGGEVIDISGQTLLYNKPDLHNPYFIVFNPDLSPVIKKIISKG